MFEETGFSEEQKKIFEALRKMTKYHVRKKQEEE